jgi:hypothetical protein
MGKIISEHRLKFSALLGRLIGIAILLGVGFGGLVAIPYLFPDGIKTQPYFQYIPIIFVLFAMAQVAQTWTMVNTHVVLFENGIQRGRNAWTWLDLTAYSAKSISYRYWGIIPVGNSYQITLAMRDGVVIMDSNSFNNISEFGDFVLSKISQLPTQPPRF